MMDSDSFLGCSNDFGSGVTTALQKVYDIKNKESRSFFTTNVDITENSISFSDLLSSEKVEKCSMDTEAANPWDICVVNINDIDYPWLIQDAEVITPFYHPQSFLDAHIKEFRHRSTPKNEMDSDSDSFLNNETLKHLENSDMKTQSFRSTTSTPVEESKRIELRIESPKTTDISLIKERLFQALEETMEKNLSMADIHILIKFNKSLVDLPKEPSVEPRMNDSTENESCQSSSSKENYYFKNNEENMPNSTAARVKFNGRGSLLDESQQKHDVLQNEVTNITASNSSSKKKKLKRRRHLRNLPEELNGNVVNKKEDEMLSKDIQLTTSSSENCLSLASNVIPENEEINIPETIHYSENEILTIEEFKGFSLEESTKNKTLLHSLPFCSKNLPRTRSESPKKRISRNKNDNCSSLLEDKKKKSFVDYDEKSNLATFNDSEEQVLSENEQLNNNVVEENTEITILPNLEVKGSPMRTSESPIKGTNSITNTTLREEARSSFGENDKIIQKNEAMSIGSSTQEVIFENKQSESTFVGDTDGCISSQKFTLLKGNDTFQDTSITEIISSESKKTQKSRKRKNSIKNTSLSEQYIVSSSDSPKNLRKTEILTSNCCEREALVEQFDRNLIESSETTSSNQMKPLSNAETICLKSPKKRTSGKWIDNTMMTEKNILLDDIDEEIKQSKPEGLVEGSEQSDDINGLISEITSLLQNPLGAIITPRKELNLESPKKRILRKEKDQGKSTAQVTGTSLLPDNEEKTKETVIPNPIEHVPFAENNQSGFCVEGDPEITPFSLLLSRSPSKTPDTETVNLGSPKKRSIRKRKDSSNSTFLTEDNIISFTDNRMTRHSLKRDSSASISAEDITITPNETEQLPISSAKTVENLPDKSLLIAADNVNNIGLIESKKKINLSKIPNEVDNNGFQNKDQVMEKSTRLKQTEIGKYLINLKSIKSNSINKNTINQELKPVEYPRFEEKDSSNVQSTAADISNDSLDKNNVELWEDKNMKVEIKSEPNVILPFLERRGTAKKRDRKRKRLAREEGLLNVGVFASPVEAAARPRIAFKSEHKDYSLGTFIWAAVSRYPYWPAIICDDPVTQKFFFKGLGNNKKHHTSHVKYHVRFFGDGGRRAWVPRSHIMEYYSRDDLDMVANKLKTEGKGTSKHPKPYLVPRSYQSKWDIAVEEIEKNRCKPYNRVMKFLFRSCSEYRRQKVKSKLVATEVSPETSSEALEPDRKKAKLDTSHITADTDSCSLLPTPDVSSEINVSNSTLPDELRDLSEIANISSSTNIHQDTDVPSDSLQSIASCSIGADENFLDNNSPRRSGRSLKSVQRINMLELRENSFVSDVSGNSENFSVAEDLNIEGVEDKINSIEKKEDNTRRRPKVETDPNIYSFKYQMELHKRNNLFNGLRNTKVCDYCFKPGEKLYKCKGRCGGLSFHMECLSNVTKPLISRINRKKNPVKSSSKLNNSRQDSVPIRSEDVSVTRSQNQTSVEIVTVKSNKFCVPTPCKENLPENYSELSVTDQIDLRMQALMSKYDDRSIYHHDSTDSEAGSTEGRSPGGASSGESTLSTPDPSKIPPSDSPISTAFSDGSNIDDEEKSSGKILTPEELLQGNAELLISATCSEIVHITADSEIATTSHNVNSIDILSLKCGYCLLDKDPPCFSCGFEVSKKGETARQKCSQSRCGRFYHLGCIKHWPQTKWAIGRWSKDESSDFFTCPAHACHTCFTEDLGSAFAGCRLPGDKLARCLLCPVAFHTSTFCIPAGSEILGGSQIICPKHRTTPIQPLNTIWCFICSKGGNLVCCENCPTSVHCECQPNLRLDDDDRYICEDCESGRFPLYDDIVWVKLGNYRWWPAVILFPNEVPENVNVLKKHRGDFAVKFFGTNDHYWVNKGRVFLFQEDDKGGSPSDAKLKKKVALLFEKAVIDAKIAYSLKKEFKKQREALCVDLLKPPPYVKINKNKPVGNVKSLELLNLSSTTACDCDPSNSNPCGPDSNCINRILLTECDPQLCRAGNKCGNQSFQKRDYPPLTAYSTQGGRGWGLKCLGPIKKGQFIIEYVGELIDSEEYQRRIQQMHDKKEENYYFMTVDSERVIDAGPKGNLSRFMNHSCNPNCITQKWTVRGDTKVGLFSKYDIPPESELTFNYNLAVVGQEKKPCKCGAINCSGFIGVKPEKADSLLLPIEARKPRKIKKRTPAPTPPALPPKPCFKCNRKKTHITCYNKACHKSFHLECVNLTEMPDAAAAAKFSCPRHSCVTCSNRTIRCCVECMNAFCPTHSEGKIRYSNYRGYVCWLHDPEQSVDEPTVKTSKRKRLNDPDEPVSSTTEENVSIEEPSTSNPRPKYKRSDYCYEDVGMVSSTPLTFFDDESTSISSLDEETELSLKQRIKKLKMKNAKEKIRISVGGLCGRNSLSKK